jgi:hypothetical protein
MSVRVEDHGVKPIILLSLTEKVVLAPQEEAIPSLRFSGDVRFAQLFVML